MEWMDGWKVASLCHLLARYDAIGFHASENSKGEIPLRIELNSC